MSKNLDGKVFHNADGEVVEYDGSPLTWRVSAYAVIIQNNELFIIKNRTEKLYDIIGGGVEFGETIEEALHREAMEEGGIKITLGKLLGTRVDWFYYKKGTFHQTLQLFYSAEIAGEISNATDPNTQWKGFIALEKLGKEYRLPVAVEEILKSNFDLRS